MRENGFGTFALLYGFEEIVDDAFSSFPEVDAEVELLLLWLLLLLLLLPPFPLPEEPS